MAIMVKKPVFSTNWILRVGGQRGWLKAYSSTLTLQNIFLLGGTLRKKLSRLTKIEGYEKPPIPQLRILQTDEQ